MDLSSIQPLAQELPYAAGKEKKKKVNSYRGSYIGSESIVTPQKSFSDLPNQVKPVKYISRGNRYLSFLDIK